MGDPEPKPTSKGGLNRLIGALVVCATLLGGVAAFLQIRESMSKSNLEPGWHALEFGEARIVTPDTWEEVDPKLVSARAGELGQSVESDRGSGANSKSWSFGQVRDIPEGGSICGGSLMRIDVPLEPGSMREIESSREGFITQKEFDHPDGRALRTTFKRGASESPIGYHVTTIFKSNRAWRISLWCPYESLALESGRFERIVQRSRFP